MAPKRFQAKSLTVFWELTATLDRMGVVDARIELGGRLSKEITQWYSRRSVTVVTEDIALYPSGAAIAFTRNGRRYRFACEKWAALADNLRAAQLAVSRLYQVYEDYGVTSGDEAADQVAFDRLFGGHLALGDGTPGPWWQELGVAPTASRAEIEQAYRRLAHQLHPDKPGGGHQAFIRLQAAYQQALAERV